MADNDTNDLTQDKIIPTGDYDDQLLQQTLAAMGDEERAEMAATGFDLPESVETPANSQQEEAVEEKPADQDGTPQGQDATGAEGQPQEEPREQGQQPMIPKARLDEVLRRASDAERYSAYLEGKLEALTGGNGNDGGGQQEQQPQQQQNRVAELTAQAEALDKRYEDGEITTAEYVKQSRSLSADIAKAEATALIEQAPHRAPVDDMRLDELTGQLEAQHPYLYDLSETDFNFLVTKAREQAAAAGRPIDTSTNRGVFELRKAVAILSDSFGPMLTGKQRQLPTQQGQQQPPAGARTAPNTKDGVSRAAQERDSKLNLQTRMPPDLNQIGRTAGPSGLTDETFLAMARHRPADLENLSAADLDHLLRS